MQVQTLTPKEQKEIYLKLSSHIGVVVNAPCIKFDNFPFKWKEGKKSVSFTAIVEWFSDVQQEDLVKKCNYMLRKLKFNFNTSSHFVNLKAIKTEDHNRQTIRFEAKTNPDLLMAEIKGNAHAHLWSHIQTYEDFKKNCLITYTINPFGNTEDVSIVDFKAGTAVPIFLMLWIYGELTHDSELIHEADGFGMVMINDRNGLPEDNSEDFHLHFTSGMLDYRLVHK
jgi:hypothetical protein